MYTCISIVCGRKEAYDCERSASHEAKTGSSYSAGQQSLVDCSIKPTNQQAEWKALHSQNFI
jgi:hypothetical protein